MAFDDDEMSHEDSRPVEVFTIHTPTTDYNIGTGKRDQVVNGTYFPATPGSRADLPVAQVAGPIDATFTIPVNHEFVRRWFRIGVPPSTALVTLWRVQLRSGEVRQLWQGLVTSVSVDRNVAKLLVPARPFYYAKKFLPTVTTGVTCPYQTYDSMCQVDRASFTFSTTLMIVNGRDVRLDLLDVARLGNWCVGGVLLHVPTGEQMTIRSQVDASPPFSSVSDLSIQRPIDGMTVGDAVQISAGDDHNITTCKNKFNNVARFGGHPYAPSRNPFVPGGSGLK